MNLNDRHRAPRSTLLPFAALVATFLPFTGAGAPPAADVSRIDDPEVRACVERMMPERALSQRLTVQVLDRSGAMRESKGALHWKRFDSGLARIIVRLTDPPHSAGLAVLMMEREDIEPDIYMYLPESRRMRRMTAGALAGRMLGTDFSYEDFTYLQQIAKTGATRRLDDAEPDGHPAFVIETLPDDETSDYSRILTYVDQALCLPVRTEFFAPNGDLHKALVIDREAVREADARHVPLRLEMIDHKQDSRSVLLVTDFEIDPELRDSLFSPTELSKGR